jgi:transcriptional regulator with XRE-family HTH domain
MQKSLVSREYRLFLSILRTAREEAGLSQEGLAKRLGETQSFISKVERGERRLDVVELRAFCRALKISFPAFVSKLDRALGASER